MTGSSAAFVDSTLREGEQTPGVVFGRSDKIRIAESLVDAGITELEAGIPALGRDEVALLKELSHLDARIICWCRSRPEDVDAALRSETGAIHISLPVSDCLLQTMDRSWDWVLGQIAIWAEYLGSRCEFFSLGAMDASRSSDERLKTFVETAVEAGFFRIRIADTLGLARPSTIMNWSRLLRKHRKLLEFHGHNDLGMAVANSLCAIEQGFGAVSATLLGLGERAGNTPLEEILLATRIALGAGSEQRVRKVGACARRCAELTGTVISPVKPLLGERINSHESGIHVAGLIRNPLSFKPYDPASLGGAEETIVWGRLSGRHGLEKLLGDAGKECPPSLSNLILKRIALRSQSLGRGLNRSEVFRIYDEARGETMLTTEGVY